MPRSGMNADKLELNARCRVNDERHIKILEHIAQFSPNEGYQLTAIRDLFDRGHGRPRQAIEGALYRLWCSYRLTCATMMTRAVLAYLFIGETPARSYEGIQGSRIFRAG